ncbi:hypothetical protein B9Z19DRAFT_1132149 [Tuber borchii]|uniref:Uncharacterized protein n=1 Tax=Tuber borchii TaxID=42251 RepID=A0A2T6ZHP9_TUBBO|nr:hypothetical protein B9Z19DRAFT_1132149 [Tuber borchii]
MAMSSKGFCLFSYRNMESECVMDDLEHLRSKALPEIALSINQQLHSSLGGRSPYKVMFNRKLRWEESIPIHSRLQQTLNNIPEEEPNLESRSQHTSSHDQESETLNLEILPESIDSGIGIPFSFNDSDNSGTNEDYLSSNLELEVEEQVLTILAVPHNQTAIENMVVQTVLEEAIQNKAAKTSARSAHKYSKQYTIEHFSAGDIPKVILIATNCKQNMVFSKNHYPVSALLRVLEAAGINISIPTTLMSTEITLHDLNAVEDGRVFGARFNVPYIAHQ